MRLWIVMALVLASGAFAQAPAPSAPAGAASADVSVRGDPAIVVDEKNHALIIRTSPSKHRKIQALLARITQDPTQGKNLKTQVFSLMNLTQQEFFDLVKYKTGLDPEDRDKFLVLRDTRNRPVFDNRIPANKLLPIVPTAGGANNAGGGVTVGGGGGANAGGGGGNLSSGQ